MAASELLTSLAKASCDMMRRCAGPDAVGLDEAECLDALDALDGWRRYEQPLLDAEVASEHIEIDRADALACVEAYASSTCVEASAGADRLWAIAPCKTMIRPLVQQAGACEPLSVLMVPYDECLDGWCDVDSGCPGSCRAYVATGASCADAFLGCRPDAHCSFESEMCVPLGSAGDPCSDYSDCTYPLECLDGTCGQRGQTGEGCSVATDCQSLICIDGTCRDTSEEGNTCMWDSQCGAGLRCRSYGPVGVCEAGGTSGLGDACSDSLECVDGAICEASVCVKPPAEGEPCLGDGACNFGTRCSNGVCEALPKMTGCDQ